MMPYPPFLQVIAQHYNQLGHKLTDYCFVFPNRRSSQFFKHYLEQEVTQLMLQPHITTISDFIADTTGDIAASPIESMFMLYHAYCELNNNEDYEFDKFVYWGGIILSDFNDVDMYRVDAEQLFKNTRELKEIATDYMTPELKATVERFLNVQVPSSEDDDKLFVKKNYLKLWQQLYELYCKFNEKIEEQGLSYRGKMMKKAVKVLQDTAPHELPFKKYVFVGFNMLSKSEKCIFGTLKKKGVAEFCWDYNSPAFARSGNMATKFMDGYVKQFPNAVQEQKINQFPHITVTGIPARTGQAKCAFNIIDQWVKNGEVGNVDNAIDTAIVLPDEALFMPLINSVSDSISNINVTVGYPLRGSDIASLMRMVANMHRHASKNGRENEYSFYRDHVKTVLSHPLIKSLFTSSSTRLLSLIDNENLFNIPESTFKNTGFENLFVTIKNLKDNNDVIAYIDNIAQFVECVEQLMNGDTQPTQGTLEGLEDNEVEASDEPATMTLQLAFLQKYRAVLNEIKEMIALYGAPMHETTVFYLIDRLVSLYTIPFQGEPLAGLQIMGVLETRCLDFKNLIVMSMNERVFPRKFFTSSFIPTFLRKAHEMATIEHQESMMAYYFFRLIARAQNVHLLYDCSSQAMGSGEYSRFIKQLNLIYGQDIHHSQLSLKVQPSNALEINVAKTAHIAQAIEAYRSEGFPKAYLSASSIKEHIKCPLKFYFHHIEKLNDDNKESEFMDAATFGSIVHDTLQQLYYPDGKQDVKGHYIVTRQAIENFKKNALNTFLIQNTNLLFLHRKEGELNTPLTGEASIIFDAMHTYACNVLNYDLELLQQHKAGFFEIYECEKTHQLALQLGNNCTFNFTYKADRIDKIGGTGPLRIIDYKTGKDETKFSNVEHLTQRNCTKNVDAIRQLFLYCNAYKQEHPNEQEIMPVIYKLRDINESGVKYGQEVVENFETATGKKGKKEEFEEFELNKKFIEHMSTLMNGEFFSMEKPISQCDKDSTTCQYCNFVEFCRR